jgi:pimeloyl-ACP methyl ester carboxylesterase
MQKAEVDLGLPVMVWTGGNGPPLLLLHGGWAGAAAHWGAVWEQLSRQFRVVAPELPGIISNFNYAMPSYRDYAALCLKLIDTLELQQVTVCGNSLGASIAWELASAHPAKLNHLVMVNGFPPRRLPAPLRWLLANRRLRAMAERTLARDFYSPQALVRAFADQRNVPDEVRRNLENPDPQMLRVMFQLLMSVRQKPEQPAAPVHWIWGVQDSLTGVTIDDGRQLSRQYSDGRLQSIDGAGHLPQTEKPSEFIAALNGCLNQLPRP